MHAFLTLLLLASAGTPPDIASPNKELTQDPPSRASTKRILARLERWTKLEAMRDSEQVADCIQTLGQLDRAWVWGHDQSDQVQLALLDFLGRCLRIEDQVSLLRGKASAGSPLTPMGEEDLRRRATALLRRRLPEARSSLTLGILMGQVDGHPHPLERRLAACEVLRNDLALESTMALLSCTRPNPPETQAIPELMDAAISGLAGREDLGVHLRLLDLLAQAEQGEIDVWKGGLERHFHNLKPREDDQRVIEQVSTYVHEAIQAEDWRRASRAITVARCLPHRSIFPQLIEALELWIERGKDETKAVIRIQGELLSELQHRSGRTLGAHPQRWDALWQGYLRGEANLRGEGLLPGRMTVGGFFGLRPKTDRVTFVLDRSGSMGADFGEESGHSRLDEAADQMARLLEQLGPRTRFNAVLFNAQASSWSKELRPADEKAIKSARKWVRGRGAKGGTHLRLGIEEAIGIDSRAPRDLDAIETDTIVVLCDGATAEGPSWVESFLRTTNDDARVVFYAVQVGAGGDGTLQSLCENTGGTYLRVQE